MDCNNVSCERVAKVEVRVDNIEDRIDKQEKLVESIYKIASTQESMIASQEKMSEKLDKMNTNMDIFNKDLIEVKNKSNNEKAKKWDKISWEIAKYVGIAILAYLLGIAFPFLAK